MDTITKTTEHHIDGYLFLGADGIPPMFIRSKRSKETAQPAIWPPVQRFLRSARLGRLEPFPTLPL
jgi:hypothetical protein